MLQNILLACLLCLFLQSNHSFLPSRIVIKQVNSFKQYNDYNNRIITKQKQYATKYNSILYATINTDDDLTSTDKNNSSDLFSKAKIIIPILAILGAAFYFGSNSGFVKTFDFTQFLESAVTKIESLGPLGYLYFSLVSVITYTA